MRRSSGRAIRTSPPPSATSQSYSRRAARTTLRNRSTAARSPSARTSSLFMRSSSDPTTRTLRRRSTTSRSHCSGPRVRAPRPNRSSACDCNMFSSERVGVKVRTSHHNVTGSSAVPSPSSSGSSAPTTPKLRSRLAASPCSCGSSTAATRRCRYRRRVFGSIWNEATAKQPAPRDCSLG